MNKFFMQQAIDIAAKSGDDIPVGAVIVYDNEIISKFHNEKEKRNDVTAHAEILALRDAALRFGNWRLNGCDMYVTLEPCPMCAWAIMQSRIDNLYFGAYDVLYGSFSKFGNIFIADSSKLNYKGGIMEEECNLILSQYFERLR